MSIQRIEQRKTYLDCLRVIAAFFVILHHTPALGLYQKLDGVKTWLYASISAITMLNTPIFFMISGALLLRKEESIKYILKHRVIKYIVVIFIINFAMYCVYGYPAMDLGAFDFIPRALRGIIDGVYWYLYAYLAFLLLLPFLQKAVKGMTWGHFWLLVSLRFLTCTFLPALNYFLRDNVEIAFHSCFDVAFAADRWVFFPVIGYFIDQTIKTEELKPRHIALIIAIGTLGILATDALMIYEGATTGFSVQFVQLFDYVTAICTFLTVKYALTYSKGKLTSCSRVCKAVSVVGGLTFGIYLLDPTWRRLFFEKFSAFLDPYMPMVFVCIFWCVCSMTCSGMITYILKKIPIVRRLL